MSGQMNNVEIEDVLSSIRRLVSEETRGTPRAHPRSDSGSAGSSGSADPLAGLRAMPSRPVEVPETGDKLLLSPAFRVPDVSGANSPEARLVPSADLASLEATIAELEAAVGAAPGIFEADGFPGSNPDTSVLGGETTPLTSDDAALDSEAERMSRVPAFVSRHARQNDKAAEIPHQDHPPQSGTEDRAFDPFRFDAVAFDHAAAQLKGQTAAGDIAGDSDLLSPDDLAELEADRAFEATADAIAASAGDMPDDAPEAAIDDHVVTADADIDEAGFETAEDAVEDSPADAAVYNFAEHAVTLRAEDRGLHLAAPSVGPADAETVFEAESEDFDVQQTDFADHADVVKRHVAFDDADVADADPKEATAPVAAAVVVPFAANAIGAPGGHKDRAVEKAADMPVAVIEAVVPAADAETEADPVSAPAYSIDGAFGGKSDDFTWHAPDPAIISSGALEGGPVAMAEAAILPAELKPAAAGALRAEGGHRPEAASPPPAASETESGTSDPVKNGGDGTDILPEPDGFSVFGEEETVIDEMALRDLIATIIREELQGALGERITRNVRKLVRAEIQQALAALDKD